jgi:hypothetical protein
MSTQREEVEARQADSQSEKLARLRAREQKLRAEASMLNARSQHLERVQRAQVTQLLRRQRTHEAVVLGVLAKKAGLDTYRLPADATKRTTPISSGADYYDRDLILGAMLWLHATLAAEESTLVQVPALAQLRQQGQESMKRRGMSASRLMRSIPTESK